MKQGRGSSFGGRASRWTRWPAEPSGARGRNGTRSLSQGTRIMCGIVGYIGEKQAATLLVDGLKRLEYRGYDSAGVSLMNGTGVETRKAKGKIAMLEAAIGRKPIHGKMGIAHTRWATHGPPNECNAHPHHDCTGTVSVVHNGIIENYGPLREMLKRTGHTFVSDTDTEVLAHLIEAAF